MPQRADAAPEPTVNVDIDSKYIVELVALDEGPSQWPDAKPGDVSLTWKFRLYDTATGAAVIDEIQNLPYELWQFSNDKTYRNKKTGNPTKAREWTEALVGRELTDEEVNDLIDLGFADALVGKRGLADLEWTTTRAGNERLKIIRLRPYKKPSAQPAQQFTADGAEVTPTRPAPRSDADKAAIRARLGLDNAA